MTARSRSTGSPARSSRPTRPTATSIRCRIASRISARGRSRPTGPTGSPIPNTGRSVTRAVEDKLSDALHERLTERFVDRRTSVLMRRLRENTGLETDISKTGEVVVEGHVDRPARRFHLYARGLGCRFGSADACGRGAEGARRRDRRARDEARAGLRRAVRAGVGRRDQVARPGRRQARRPPRRS